MVEWDGLENRFARKRNVGSNPTLSADEVEYQDDGKERIANVK